MPITGKEAVNEAFYHTVLYYTGRIALTSPSSHTRLGHKELAEIILRDETLKKTHNSLTARTHREPRLLDADFNPESPKTPTLREQIEAIYQTNEFGMIMINDPMYPESLKSMLFPPPILYYQGDISLLDTNQNPKRTTVVGTRDIQEAMAYTNNPTSLPSGWYVIGKRPNRVLHAMRYRSKERKFVDLPLDDYLKYIQEGESAVQKITATGKIVVSGLAPGCDTLAHQTAIATGGKTIAVLGSSLDDEYPKSRLRGVIRADYLLISQYPLGINYSTLLKSTLPFRNATTVGLSTDWVVIVRTEDHGGTQYAITAAYEQGKRLCVLPNSKNFEWVEKQKKRFDNRDEAEGSKKHSFVVASPEKLRTIMLKNGQRHDTK